MVVFALKILTVPFIVNAFQDLRVLIVKVKENIIATPKFLKSHKFDMQKTQRKS